MNNNLYNTGGYIPAHAMNGMNNYTEKYVEDYLRNHLGRNIEAHVSFCDSIEWRDSVFTGILEDIGKDYIVIRNNDNSYIIWNIYIDYIVLKNTR